MLRTTALYIRVIRRAKDAGLSALSQVSDINLIRYCFAFAFDRTAAIFTRHNELGSSFSWEPKTLRSEQN